MAPTSSPGSEPLAASETAIPGGLTLAAGWAVRLMILGVFCYLLFRVLAFFSLVTIPVGVGILIAALLEPLVRLIQRLGLGRLPATLIALVVSLLLLGGIFALVVVQAVADGPALVNQTMTGIRQALDWLAASPLHLSPDLNTYLAQLQTWLSAQAASLAGSAAGLGTSIGNFAGGTITAVMAAFFFLADGKAIAEGIGVWLIPDGPEATVPSGDTGGAGRPTLGRFPPAPPICCASTRSLTSVALIDWSPPSRRCS